LVRILIHSHPFINMAKPQSNENLAEIVRGGASRPIRKWIIIIVLLALLGGGVWFW
jgi:hypothetical protein